MIALFKSLELYVVFTLKLYPVIVYLLLIYIALKTKVVVSFHRRWRWDVFH